MTKNGINPIGTDADEDLAWVAVLWKLQIEDLMHITPSEDQRACYASDADIMMTRARSKIKSLIRKDVMPIFAELTQAGVPNQNI